MTWWTGSSYPSVSRDRIPTILYWVSRATGQQQQSQRQHITAKQPCPVILRKIDSCILAQRSWEASASSVYLLHIFLHSVSHNSPRRNYYVCYSARYSFSTLILSVHASTPFATCFSTQSVYFSPTTLLTHHADTTKTTRDNSLAVVAHSSGICCRSIRLRTKDNESPNAM